MNQDAILFAMANPVPGDHDRIWQKKPGAKRLSEPAVPIFQIR